MEDTQSSLLILKKNQLISYYIIFILIAKLHKDYWGGWTKESFKIKYIKEFSKLSGPMVISYTLKNIGGSVITIATGRLPPINLATSSVLVQLLGILDGLISGIEVMTETRVGYYLGKGSKKYTKQ